METIDRESGVSTWVTGLLMAPPTDGGSPIVALVVQMALIFLIFYWLLIRPQRKERERHDAMIAALKKGDEVVTAGGIVGAIVHVDQDRLTIRTGESTKVVIERSKVSRLLGGPEVEKR
jgi:preprotein translocase subunit YajC